MTSRPIVARYDDPVSLIWLSTAHRLGLRVRFSDAVFASFDGHDLLTLGTSSSLDPDDHLAQMILHELCHWITNGQSSRDQIDWGFPPSEDPDWREYAALRLQAQLADQHGLRQLLAPTTDARFYYDQVKHPLTPLDDSPQEAQIVARARVACERAAGPPWGRVLQDALTATAALLAVVRPFAAEVPDLQPSLWGMDP